jgi:DMSO reductase anchor subunit
MAHTTDVDAIPTRPATRRRSRSRPAARRGAIDPEHATPADPHGALVAMLVGSQLAVGLLAAALVASMSLPTERALELAALGALVLVVALASSLQHLGRSWRALLGARSSWLRREVVAFGSVTVLAAAYLASAAEFGARGSVTTALETAAAGVGLGGVACSAMVYYAIGRRLWHVTSSVAQFFGTTLVLGAGVLGLAAAGAAPALMTACAGIVVIVTLSKLAAIAALLARVDARNVVPIARTIRLLQGPLRALTASRMAAGTVASSCAVAFVCGHPFAAMPMFAWSLLGETLERVLFLRVISPARTPGGF